MSRSPKRKPVKANKTVALQTHVTSEVGRKVEDKLGTTGENQSQYLRRLVLTDLGILPTKDATK